MIFNPIRSFRVKVTIILVLTALFVLVLSNTVIYQMNLRERLQSLRRELMSTAQVAALSVNAEELQQVPLNAEGLNSPPFILIRDKLIQIQKTNPLIKYIYTMTKTSTDGVWQFIVDVDPYSPKGKDELVRSYPGDKYNASRFPEMMKAFDGPSADKKIEVDEWGATLSGYAPIRNSAGRTVAVLGVDVDAGDVYALYRSVRDRTIFVLIFGIGLSIIAAFLFSRKIHRPISELLEGTRRIAKGELNFQVPVHGDDEISELARAFNQMAKDLSLSRQRLVRYFYSIIRSLIKVLEARDQYTKGHSEKVARYAGKIAMKMGLTRAQVGLFRKMTLLHDIGKVGIKDSILNKPGNLTPEEWEAIKKHPEIGEQILKPVLDNPDLLSVVRGHHERYDGQGYPDGLSKDQINIYAAIVSVADAYDAMTSDRAYRKALSPAEAIEELKKNRGTQFNPDVVDAFLAVLGDEGKKGFWDFFKKRKGVTAVILFLFLATPCFAQKYPLNAIKLPAGFKIDLYAIGVKNARSMVLSPNGTLFVGTRTAGNVYAIVDENQDNRADKIYPIAQGLLAPNGVDFRDGSLYVTEINRVIRFDDIEQHLSNPPEPVVLNDSFLNDQWHGWKVARFGPDGKFYVAVGSPCNTCITDGFPYGKIMRMDADGKNLEDYSSGIRNSVGFDWDPRTKHLWFTDNGRDELGDDVPPDELNYAPKKGMHFGFPYCHGENISDPEFGKDKSCKEFTPPAQKLVAHAAALGMRFYTGDMFPQKYRNSIFIAEHGSWNRTSKVGYRVMRVEVKKNKAVSYEEFASGWKVGEQFWGRPVDVLNMPDGSLLVSDDHAGVIYRISYEGGE